MSFRTEMTPYFQEKGFYVVTKKDHPRYLEVLTESFYDYPLMKFVIGEKFDRKKVEKFYDVSIKAMGDNCITIADSAQINGTLCFYAPGEEPGTMEFIKNGALSFVPAYGLGRVIKAIRYLDRMEGIMKKYRTEKDIYIYTLATLPQMQKRGIAHRLMGAALDYCAENHYGAYMETNEADNSVLYQGMGFTLKEEVRIRDAMKLYSLYKPAE